MLLDLLEGNRSEIDSILNQINFVFSSFNPTMKQFPFYFGINRWNYSTEFIKAVLKREEPRIEVISVESTDREVLIRFRFRGGDYEFCKLV